MVRNAFGAYIDDDYDDGGGGGDGSIFPQRKSSAAILAFGISFIYVNPPTHQFVSGF